MVKHNLSIACVTDFLHTLHRKKIDKINLKTLPRDSKTLTKVIIYTPFIHRPALLFGFSLSFSSQISDCVCITTFETQVPKDANLTEFTVADISETVSRGETELEQARRVRRNVMAQERAEATGQGANIPILDDPVVHETVKKRHYMHLGVEDVCTMRSPGTC